ncbi:MAG TPA: hypothetical protein VMU04_21175 [Candidatus Acidoferrum sp.]|nr:hypothetical protein [Candidatus Acidoferrum sp.]
MINLTPQQLRQAADLLEQIQELQNQLNTFLGGAVESAPATPTGHKTRKMSAAGRAAIAAAARARWAKYNAAKGKPAKKGKRKLSAQGLANIRAGVAKRVAKQGKAAQSSEKPKRKLTPAMKAALERAWAARRAKSKA